jgi:hypothetical protein
MSIFVEMPNCCISIAAKQHTISGVIELDASVGPLIKDYPFCGENILGQMLRKTGIKVQRWRLRESMHHLDVFEINERKKKRIVFYQRTHAGIKLVVVAS